MVKRCLRFLLLSVFQVLLRLLGIRNDTTRLVMLKQNQLTIVHPEHSRDTWKAWGAEDKLTVAKSALATCARGTVSLEIVLPFDTNVMPYPHTRARTGIEVQFHGLQD